MIHNARRIIDRNIDGVIVSTTFSPTREGGRCSVAVEYIDNGAKRTTVFKSWQLTPCVNEIS